MRAVVKEYEAPAATMIYSQLIERLLPQQAWKPVDK
jgi:hypothetical protein